MGKPGPQTKYHTSVRWIFFALALMLLFAYLAGCAGPSYYAQAVSGHFRLMSSREDITALLEQKTTDPDLARKLELALEIRQFAFTELNLPENDSYTQLAATGQEAVTWNVVAAPEFALEPKTWCFVVSGCVPYRGYFKQEAAVEFSRKLERDGYDVSVSPAVAYSTLGWFDDPLLDTMLNYSDENLAAFIFHELAHQKLYVKGDTAFNEAFASFVEETGVRLWLASTGSNERLADWLLGRKASIEFNELLQASRKLLEEEYGSGHSGKEMRENKSAIFTGLRNGYQALVKNQWNGTDFYGSWFSRELNNAQLALIASYQGGACAFEKLYQSANGNLPQFYALAKARAGMNIEQRTVWLNEPCDVIASNADL
jgi:predicted aminopeptidase